MRVIVCGAGQVGTTLARHLSSEENDVVVIDQSEELIRRMDDSLDVRGIVGYASRPSVLEQAGAADADMIIAATVSDEVNMMACIVGHILFHIPTKIARVRDQEYSAERWSGLLDKDRGLPINVIISPEQEVARAIMRRLHAPGAIEMIELADNAIRLVGVRLGEECPIINTPLRQLTALFPDLNIQIVGVVRNGRSFVPSDQDQLFPRDEVYFVADTLHVPRAMAAVGQELPESHRVIIVGGGNIGQRLARIIEEEDRDISAMVIELDPARAQTVAQRLARTIVLNGDAMDPDLLEEANVHRADTIIAVTDHDETNILSSLLAKRFGAKQAIALVTRPALFGAAATARHRRDHQPPRDYRLHHPAARPPRQGAGRAFHRRQLRRDHRHRGDGILQHRRQAAVGIEAAARRRRRCGGAQGQGDPSRAPIP